MCFVKHKMGLKLLIFSIFCLTVSGSIDPAEDEVTCGYPSCDPGLEDRLNVHIICHSHDDVGWLKTVDQVSQYLWFQFGSKSHDWSHLMVTKKTVFQVEMFLSKYYLCYFQLTFVKSFYWKILMFMSRNLNLLQKQKVPEGKAG